MVPTLFFFQNKDDYDTFASQVKNIPTRDIKFQKLFAKYAKGVYALSTFSMGVTVLECTKRLQRLMKRDKLKLPISEINQCGMVDDRTILLCNDKEIHRFSCNDKFSRDKWVKKVNKLVDKRAQRLININNGLMMSGVRKSVGGDDALPMTPSSPATLIGGSPLGHGSAFDNNIVTRNARASMYKLSKIKAVEADFD